jgi:hypothetical protein
MSIQSAKISEEAHSSNADLESPGYVERAVNSGEACSNGIEKNIMSHCSGDCDFKSVLVYTGHCISYIMADKIL